MAGINTLFIKFNDISFHYDDSVTSIFEHVSLHLPRGWTGLVGANGSGKTTFLRLAAGELTSCSGSIESTGTAVYCSQRTDDPPSSLIELIRAGDSESQKLMHRLGMENDWYDRWDTLSHGERKRAQLGASIRLNPDILAVDEPCNHLDMETRTKIERLLAEYRGVGLLVSHDRDLLDNLCVRCLFFEPPSIEVRPGGYTDGLVQKKREEQSLAAEYHAADAEYKRLKREITRRREKAGRSDARRSKRHLARGDSDGRSKIDAARLTGKDAKAGRLFNQLKRRVDRVHDRKQSHKIRKTYRHGIELETAVSHRDALFRIPGGGLSLGETKRLEFENLVMRPDDRIALTGPNGTGKSTLIEHIYRNLSVERDSTVYLPQEVDIEASKHLLERLNDLSGDRLGRVMTIIRRLGSDPERILETKMPSPGEVRKLLLALGMSLTPCLIVMDEPTNHLDIVSIECLEDALAETRCGLLLVSHDRRFLKRLTTRRWHITGDNETCRLEEVYTSV